MPDERCLMNDHHFQDGDGYDAHTGDPLPTLRHIRCTRCGVTLERSILNISDDTMAALIDKAAYRKWNG